MLFILGPLRSRCQAGLDKLEIDEKKYLWGDMRGTFYCRMQCHEWIECQSVIIGPTFSSAAYWLHGLEKDTIDL